MTQTIETRGWAFRHPDFDAPSEDSGLTLRGAGGIAMTDSIASIRQSLLLLLSTMPGERLMRPDYGCDLHRLMFSTNDDTTAGLAIHYVRQAVTRWEPRVKIVRLDAQRSEGDPGRLELILRYRRRGAESSQEIRFNVDLGGGEPA